MVRQGGKKTDVFINHNTGRSAICMDCQNTVTNVNGQTNNQNNTANTGCLSICLFVRLCLALNDVMTERVGCVRSLLYSALQTKKKE